MNRLLSPRELAIIQLYAKGHTIKEIAERLDISIKTVDTHKKRAHSKLGITDRVSLIQYAVDHDWIQKSPRQTDFVLNCLFELATKKNWKMPELHNLMLEAGLNIPLPNIRSWRYGYRAPNIRMIRLILKFIEKHSDAQYAILRPGDFEHRAFEYNPED